MRISASHCIMASMVDFVSFFESFCGSISKFSQSICEYIVYSAEITVVIQAVLSIGAAALALVGAYIIISCFIDSTTIHIPSATNAPGFGKHKQSRI